MADGNTKVQFDIYQISTAADIKVHKGFFLEGEYFIESINFVPDAAVSTDGSNYTTLTLTNETDSATLATIATNATALVLETAVTATVTEGTSRKVSQGDVISYDKADTGSGATAGGVWSLYLTRRNF